VGVLGNWWVVAGRKRRLSNRRGHHWTVYEPHGRWRDENTDHAGAGDAPAEDAESRGVLNLFVRSARFHFVPADEHVARGRKLNRTFSEKETNMQSKTRHAVAKAPLCQHDAGANYEATEYA
jgi:hypothetical protein